jgi:hypothetical protein
MNTKKIPSAVGAARDATIRASRHRKHTPLRVGRRQAESLSYATHHSVI